MVNGLGTKVNVELPWETVELIVRNALKEDIEMAMDPDTLAAFKLVYEYYGGYLDEQTS